MKTLFRRFVLLSRNGESSDNAHSAARSFTSSLEGRIITRAWVVAEIADGIAQSKNRTVFLRILAKIHAGRRIEMIWPERALFEAGLKLYAQRMDKDWSLTDCISFEVMRHRGIIDALTGDHHFEQAGFTALLK